MPCFSRSMILLCFGLCFLSTNHYGQSYVSESLYSNNKLKASTIYKITQDHDGFIWIGTNEGLFRFDGIEYQQFTVNDGLSDMEVFNLAVDSQNHIFISDFSGKLNFYHQGAIHNVYNDIAIAELQMDRLNLAFYPFDDAFIVHEYKNYFYYLKCNDGKFSVKEKIPLASDTRISSIVSNENEWYVFYADVERRERHKYYDVYEKTRLKKRGEFHLTIIDAEIIDSIVFFISSEFPNSILTYKINSDFSLTSLSQHQFDFKIKYLFKYQNELWFTSHEGGVLSLDGVGVKEHFLPNKRVNNLFIDHKSNLWIGTEGEGLYFLRKNKIVNLGYESLKVASLITSLASGSDQQIYVGYNKLMLGEIRGSILMNNYKIVEDGDDKLSRVLKLEVLDDHRILCGTDEGLFELNTHENAKPIRSTYLLDAIKDFVRDNNNDYWIGAVSGLHLLKNKEASSIISIWEQRVITLHLDQEETLWIGNLQGLYYKKKDSREIQKYIVAELEHKKINDIESRRNKLFVATDFGVYIIDKHQSKSVLITKEQGLFTNQCRKIVLEKNYLWITSSEGVTRIELFDDDFRILDVQTYTTFDGLLSNDVNDLIVRNDTLWVATNKGLSILPLSNRQNVELPKINIVKASTNLEEHNIFEAITLSPDKNNISIAYSGMSFGDVHYDTYYYRLLPVVNEWAPTTENTIAFFELQPGHYTFEVRAINNKKNKGKTPASLKFEVEASFVQTWFFKMLLGLLVFAIIALVFYWREREIVRKTKFEKTVSSLELEAIKAQINPHFIYNCLNSIKNTILKKEVENAEKQISVFASLVRQTLTISQRNFIGLDQEIQYLEQYLEMEKIRFKEFLNYEVTHENITELNQIKLPTMLIQPFVENAIKHGVNPDNDYPCKVRVNFKLEDEVLFCEVEDNGPGLKNVKHESRFSNYIPQGMRISSSRGKAYQTLYGMDIKINVFDKKENHPLTNGVIINIEIPLSDEI